MFSSSRFIGRSILILLPFGGAVLGETPEVHPEAARLQIRTQLAREARLYVELKASSVTVSAAGWDQMEFTQAAEWSGPKRPIRLTKVSEVEPLQPPPERVLDVGDMSAPDPSGTASSLEDIVGVDQMPEIFLVRFDDGTAWLVRSEDWGGWGNRVRGNWLQLKLLVSQWLAEDPAPLVFLATDAVSARHLYWLLQKDFPVIQ